MQKAQEIFNQAIKKSELNDIEQKLIENLIEEFPYFQLAQLIQYKNNLNKGEFNAGKNLGKLALQTYNRHFLFELTQKSEQNEHTEYLNSDDIETTIPGFSFQLEGVISTANDDDPIIIGENLIEYEAPSAFDLEKEYTFTGFKTQKTNRTSELIDSFLKQRSSEKKAEPKPIVPSEDKSLEIPNDLVSETLAKIYLKQSKYTQAIEVYEKLMLVEPEKKAIFARSISEIRTKIE